MKSHVDSNTLQEVLEDLESRLEAYLVEWRLRLGILEERPEVGIDRNDQHSAISGEG